MKSQLLFNFYHRIFTFFSMTVMVMFQLQGKETNTVGTKESESETIAKCLEDLRSHQVDKRKRAVLILGKYSNSRARNAILNSLKDDNASIRRSALVSLTERPVFRNAVQPILFMIGDSDVHIRRIASSYLPEIMRSYRFPSSGNLARLQRSGYPPELESILKRSFDDEDLTVRKNMIMHYHYFQQYLSEKMLKKLLHDPDREVRILALTASQRLLAAADLLEVLNPLTEDPDRTIRMQLCQILKNRGDNSADKVLKKLTDDRDFEISTMAYSALFQHGDVSVYPVLRERFEDPRMNPVDAKNIIRMVPRMGKSGEKALLNLMEHTNSMIKHSAVEVYGRSYWKNADPMVFIHLMDDSSRKVRDAAANILNRSSKLSKSQLDPLVFSEYPDVREKLVSIIRRLPKAHANEILLELILDDVNHIRLKSLEQIFLIREEGWEEIARISLEDEYPEIQQKTINFLIKSNSPKAHQILMNFADKTHDVTLKRRILSSLHQRKAKGNKVMKPR